MLLLPTPKSCVMQEGEFSLTDTVIILADGLDIRLTDAALTLQRDIARRFGVTPCVRVGPPQDGGIRITAENGGGEGYTLRVEPNGICLAGQSAKGAFYGIQTLRQMVNTADRPRLACCRVTDEPDYESRGFYHDVTRGRVPTLDRLKGLCDTLSYYKMNALQLYTEDAFAFRELEGIMKPEEVLTPAEIRELDEYCYRHFVELVPSVSTFGHLYTLLQSPRYRHLCEYENFVSRQHPWIEKMMHHTIDPYQEESLQVVCSMIDQMIGLCRSDSFNICCDETFDLCKGRNAGKDTAAAYFDFVSKIIAHVQARGKRVMMWGDIALHYPEKLSLLPRDTVLLNWNYCKQPDDRPAKVFAESGLTQYVCPGTWSWNRFLEDADCSGGNIGGMAAIGQQYGAKGLLTTNWGDFGNVCSLNGALYGLTLGAQKGWNVAAPTDSGYERAFSRLAYGQEENMAAVIRTLGQYENTAGWGGLIQWISENEYEGKTTPLAADPAACRRSIQGCDLLLQTLGRLPQTQPVSDLQLAAKGIRLMNQMYLHIVAGEKAPCDTAAFLAEYRSAWLRDNKLSQLERIEAVFQKYAQNQ